MTDSKSDSEPRAQGRSFSSFLGLGFAVGISAGTAFGVASGNLALGIGCGIGLGPAFALGLAALSNRRRRS